METLKRHLKKAKSKLPIEVTFKHVSDHQYHVELFYNLYQLKNINTKRNICGNYHGWDH